MRRQGIVQWWGGSYGFISSDGLGNRIFCYFADLVAPYCRVDEVKNHKYARIGDRVEFELCTTERGLAAKKVTVEL